MEKSLWVLLEGEWEKIKPFVTSSLETGVDALWIDEKENIEKTRELARGVKIASKSGKADMRIVEINDEEDIKKLQKEDCALITIDSKEKENLAERAGKICRNLLIFGEDWTIIPLENLIAALQKEKVKLLAGVKSADEIRTALETLEVGVSGVILKPENLSDIKKAREILEKADAGKIEIKKARVVKIEPLGMGDRVCVDTTSMMDIGEGMLIGSQAKGLFLIHSESVENPYVATRPFRVNAGAVHAYVKAPKNKTKYLSELKSGDEILIVDSQGNARTANVGRVKIEKRPLILIEADCGGQIIKTIVQNAETIRFVNSNKKPVSVAKLKTGDEILVSMSKEARHFGMGIEESIIER